MEDLSEKLTQLLSSPEGMSKIQSMMTALGGALPQEEAPPPPPPPQAAGIDLAAISKIMPLLGQMNQESEDTRLLAALRPYLHGPRAERLEESMRLMKLMKLLPLLTEGGVKNGG